jgi:signal transduction histidine kinase
LVPGGRDERDHELRAALFGIEASAQGLSRHRELLTVPQFDELAEGLVAEVRRLRGLVDGRISAPSTFDLAAAIRPVIACARASGLPVCSSVPDGLRVEGRSDSTAQVVLALLDNARQHAASSPVELRLTVLGDTAALRVEDRGKGIGAIPPERVFERGVRGDDSPGSGLGLYIARKLMAEQGGTIGVRSRHGGGASFVLRFRRAPRAQQGTQFPLVTIQ